MEEILDIVFISLLYISSITVYVWLIAYALPKLFFAVTYEANTYLGRGLKKIKHPDGRAVLYEPHPSVRKYMDKYLLFSTNGCKYFQCRVNEYVSSYKMSLISYDSRGRVIDVLDVAENSSSELTRPVQLHHKTSYVIPVLTFVNGKKMSVEPYMFTRVKRWPLYLISCALATFLQFLHIVATANWVSSLVGVDIYIGMEYLLFAVASVVISIVCMLVTIGTKKKKGIKVVLR